MWFRATWATVLPVVGWYPDPWFNAGIQGCNVGLWPLIGMCLMLPSAKMISQDMVW